MTTQTEQKTRQELIEERRFNSITRDADGLMVASDTTTIAVMNPLRLTYHYPNNGGNEPATAESTFYIFSIVQNKDGVKTLMVKYSSAPTNKNISNTHNYSVNAMFCKHVFLLDYQAPTIRDVSKEAEALRKFCQANGYDFYLGQILRDTISESLINLRRECLLSFANDIENAEKLTDAYINKIKGDKKSTDLSMQQLASGIKYEDK